jgi:predicted dehydrogenase
MRKLRYGILSTASIVPRFVKGMRQTENGEITAIASRTADKAKQTAEELGIPFAYGDYRELLKNPEIDVVYIPVINALHFPFARDALLAGKHVLMEKPFVLRAEEAEELQKLAGEKHLFLTEAVKTPHLPVYADVLELIRSEELGTLQFMDFRQSYNSGPYVRGWNVDPSQGGGVLYGNEAYFLTMAQFLAGPVLSVSGSAVFPENEAESQIAVSAVFAKGILANLCVSRKVLFENGLKLYFENGRIELPDYWKADKALVYQGEECVRTISHPCDSEFTYELNHYNMCILEGRTESPVTPLETTIRNTRLVESLYESWNRTDMQE